jgi:plastocyanin
LALLASGGALAQGEEGGHPAHIHSGTCDELGDVLYPLSNVGPGAVRNGTPDVAGDEVGSDEDLYPIDISVTTIDASLADIANGDTAINVHESADEIQNYIACGNIGGTMFGDSLVIGLETLNDSGYNGVAVLTADGEQTEVTVYLGEGLAGDDDGMDMEGDDSGKGSDDEDDDRGGDEGNSAGSSVDIADRAFGPATLEIAAGTTVTWTNNDGTAHTVTADDGSFDSENLDPGATYSFTFDTPGTYTYHCDYHSSMTATIVVS